MLDHLRLRLGMRLCRVLPPSLAYRLDFALLSDLGRKPIPFEARALFGEARIRGSMDCAVESQFALHGTCNYLGLAAARALCRHGDTVLELGANVGTETLSLADVVGRTGQVIAVEPMPASLALLRERVRANGLDQVRIVQGAIAPAPGSIHMQPQHHHGLAFASETADTGSVTVPGITVDALCAAHGAPAFVWVDVEGYELKALHGAIGLLAGARPVIFTEVDSKYLRRAGDTLEDLLDLVHEARYAAFDAQSRAVPRVETVEPGPGVYHSDWLLVPRERESRLVPRLRGVLRRARFLPQVRGLSPIA